MTNMGILFDSKADKHEGFVDRVENGWVFGWAWKLSLPNEPIAVDLYVDGKLACTSTANLYRPDLESTGKGDGRHAFEIRLPGSCCDGQTHVIRVVYHGTMLDLCGSPQSVSFGPKGIAEDDSRRQMAGPTFHSRFGGLWTDLPNAKEVIEGKARLGWISNAEVELLNKWLSEGFVILPRAVSPELIDSLDREVEEIWCGRSRARCFVEVHENGTGVIYPAGPSFKDRRVKLLDLYFKLQSARMVIFAPSVLRFLNLIFERPAVAFQSLYFRWGSQQDVHQDTAFVKVSSPLEFAASWIALEDIQPGSGELEYYIGSHRLDDYLFEGQK